jgi:hypothetical protein
MKALSSLRARLSRKLSRGAIMVEYVMLLTAVAIPVSIASIAAGKQMVKQYSSARSSILQANP